MCRAIEILDTRKLWFSPFHDLNDPMEGVFQTSAGPVPDELKKVDALYSQKLKYGICSFSGPDGFANPAMWGYYANRFKGMAVEVEVEGPDVHAVTYEDGPPIVNQANEIPALLTTKRLAWWPEDEVRVLRESAAGLQTVGKITAVYFGNPFGDLVNTSQICSVSPNLQKYREVSDFLVVVAAHLGIPTKRVRVSAEGKVESFDWQP